MLHKIQAPKQYVSICAFWLIICDVCSFFNSPFFLILFIVTINHILQFFNIYIISRKYLSDINWYLFPPAPLYFIFYFDHSWCHSLVFLALHSEITNGRLLGPFGMWGIEPRSHLQSKHPTQSPCYLYGPSFLFYLANLQENLIFSKPYLFFPKYNGSWVLNPTSQRR